jgi:hypothetical protein
MTLIRQSSFVAIPLLAASLSAGCAQRLGGDASAAGPTTPGWTGRTVVVGNTSTIAGDAAATELQQKWPTGGRSD